MFHVVPADVDETRLADEDPSAYVLRLVEAKARAVLPQVRTESIVIAADTIVVDGSDILGKPTNMLEAEQMLRQLRGRVHQVYTAIGVLRCADEAFLTDLNITDVPMRAYTDEEMHAYIATGDPLDKAGGYAIQHPRFQPVQDLQGCYAGVMGLPLCHLVRTMAKFGITPQAEVPRACQNGLRYVCPVFRQILRGE